MAYEAEREANDWVPWHVYRHGQHMAIEPEKPCWPDCYPPQPKATNTDREKRNAELQVEVLAGQLTPLRGYGNVLRGACPVHGGSNTSAFAVYIDTQSWYCFNCEESGDAVALEYLLKGTT